MFNPNDIIQESSFDSKIGTTFEGNCTNNFSFWTLWNGKGSEDVRLTIYDNEYNIEQMAKFPDAVITKLHANGDGNITAEFDHGYKTRIMNESDVHGSIKFDEGFISYNFYDM